MTTGQQYLFDFSLGLINRTGAYHIGKDLLVELPHYFPEVRYWRLIRRIAGRLMLREFSLLCDSPHLLWPEGRQIPGRRRLFFDPLYVLRSRLDEEDIVLCHDIGPVSHPELYGEERFRIYTAAYEKLRRSRCGMLFASDASQAAFRDRYGDDFRFLQTIVHYVRAGVMGGETAPVPGLKPPFLLTVGALEPRKNHRRIMEAYQRSGLWERGIGYVYCGARAEAAKEARAQAARTPGVTALGYVSEAQLRWLYENSCGFVLPSLLEGVGLPVIEAAQRGLLSVTSAGGAQEEAIGGAAVLVDPTSTASIADGLVHLVEMSGAERREMLERAQRRAKVLTYERYIGAWDKVLGRNDKFPDTDGWAASDPEEKALLQPALP
ncbi:glycosyltransferase [Roseicella aquatilis]|nr:glycosyltransferase [Roseicella aquatilis]